MKTVLIADDDLFVRTFLRDVLSPEGYELLEAADGESALSAAREAKPDVVLLDLIMPKRSGLDVFGEIQRQSPASKILVISSLDAQSLVDQAMKMGAVGFVTKPFHPLEIAAAVKKAAGG